MESGSRALEVLVRTEVEGVGWQTNREGPASRTFSAKQSATDAWQKTTRQALTKYPCRQIGFKNEQRRILTDRSDSQIAEDPESVSTAQGC